MLGGLFAPSRYVSILSKNYIDRSSLLRRTYKTLLSEEFDVSQFCTINIKCPHRITIKPIDLFNNQERVLMKLNANNTIPQLPKVTCEKENDIIFIDIPAIHDNESLNLIVDAPVKASLNVDGTNGDIDIGSFYGQFIKVKGDNCNINLSKSQSEQIALNTNSGNITCKGVIQAGDIALRINNTGKITTDKVQGLTFVASTTNGSIIIGSSYCDISTFETNVGELNLQNLHKHVNVNIKEEALLNIVGLNGDLSLYMKKGLADIQFAKIAKDSKISVEDQSSLILRLSEECQKNNYIEVLTNNLLLSHEIKMQCVRNSEGYILLPKSKGEYLNKLEVHCRHSDVSVNATSWSELIQASLKTKT